MNGERILFIDRDGTLIEEPDDEQVDSLPKLKLMPGVIPALIELRDAGFRFVLVSNQDGLGTPSFPASFREPQEFLRALLESQGIRFDAEFFCHHAADGCDCRKPRIGLLRNFLAERSIDRSALRDRRSRHGPGARCEPGARRAARPSPGQRRGNLGSGRAAAGEAATRGPG